MNLLQLALIKFKQIQSKRNGIKCRLGFLQNYKAHAFKHVLVEKEKTNEHRYAFTDSNTEMHCWCSTTRYIGGPNDGQAIEKIEIIYTEVTGRFVSMDMQEFALKGVPVFIIDAALCAGLHPIKCCTNPKSAIEFFKAVGVSVSDLDMYQNLKCSPKEAADIIRSAQRVKASTATPAMDTIDMDFSEVLAAEDGMSLF